MIKEREGADRVCERENQKEKFSPDFLSSEFLPISSVLLAMLKRLFLVYLVTINEALQSDY